MTSKWWSSICHLPVLSYLYILPSCFEIDTDHIENELAYGLLSFPSCISLLITLPILPLTPYLPWVNRPQDALCKNPSTASSYIEGIARVWCKNLCIISPLISQASSDTWCSFPYIWTGPRCSHSRLHFNSTALSVLYDQSLRLIVQVPLQFLWDTTGINKSIIICFCSPSLQSGIPTGTVNHKSASSPIFFLHKKFISRGTTIRWDL